MLRHPVHTLPKQVLTLFSRALMAMVGAPTASFVEYEDVVIPDMMDLMAQQSKFPVKRPPVPPPSGEVTLEAGPLKSHLFSKLRIISETVCEEPKVHGKIGRLCSQILDQFDGPTLQVGAFVELLTDLTKLLEAKKVVGPDKTIPLQARLLLAQHGFRMPWGMSMARVDR